MLHEKPPAPIIGRQLLVAFCLSFTVHGLILVGFGMAPRGEMVTTSSSLQLSLVASAPQSLNMVPSVLPATSVNEVQVLSQEKTAVEKKPLPLSRPIPKERLQQTHRTSAIVTPGVPIEQESPRLNSLPGLSLPGQSGSVQRVEIEFELFSGADRQFIGAGRHRFVSEKGEYYGVSVEQALAVEGTSEEVPWKLEISGRIGGDGLSPVFFEGQGAVSERLIAVKSGFSGVSRSTGTIRKGRMRDGVIDRQTLLYHFSFKAPEVAGGKIWLTDGTNLELFTYSVVGFESFPVRSLGDVNALKLVLAASTSNETIELWLAPDLRYLPIRMRHTDRLSVVTEQLVISLVYQ